MSIYVELKDILQDSGYVVSACLESILEILILLAKICLIHLVLALKASSKLLVNLQLTLYLVEDSLYEGVLRILEMHAQFNLPDLIIL